MKNQKIVLSKILKDVIGGERLPMLIVAQDVKNIIDKWNPGAYNISYDFTRDPNAIKTIYPKSFETKEKLGPTGKKRGLLLSNKLRQTFNFDYEFRDYKSTIRDYYEQYEKYETKTQK